MTTLLLSHEACLAHDTAPGHPECPDRLRAILNALDAPAFSGLLRREAPRAEIAALTRVHPKRLVEALLAAIPAEGYASIDADTILSPGSGEAALRAAGAICAGIDAVMAGEATNAFCAVRPPGHHAEPSRPMGFCLFDNIAVGARHALVAHGLAKVAIVDFDVHHGNGTQAAFENEPAVFFASTHQMPLYPGTGASSETGRGNILNYPLPPGAGGVESRRAMERTILPAVEAFAPEMILVSAGFDAHSADPLASLNFETEDFAWATRELVALAGRVCSGRLVSTLEGGYDLRALAESAAAHVSALMAA